MELPEHVESVDKGSVSKSQQLGFAVAILIGFCVISFPWLGDIPFSSRGEPREALVAQAMIETGNYILPQGYEHDVPSKPPFLHWLIVLCALFSGEVSEVTSRLPSVCASLFFLVGWWLFTCRRRTMSVANSCIVWLLLCPEWFRVSLIARVDMVHSVSLAGTLLALWSVRRESSRRFLFLTLLLLTGAILSKGPVGAALPLLVSFIWFGILRRDVPHLVYLGTRIFTPAILFSGVWYVLALFIGGEAFLDKVYDENVGRFLGDMHFAAHRHSIFYLYGSLVLGMLPIAAYFAFGASKVGWRRLPGELKKPGAEFERYSLVVVSVIALFYALPASKRSVYLLPLYPFAVTVLEYILRSTQDTFEIPNSVRRAIGSGVLILALTLAIGCSTAWLTQPLFGHYSQSASQFASALFLDHHARGIVVLILVVLLAFVLIRAGDLRHTNRWLVGLYGALALFLQSTVSPAVALLTSERKVAELIQTATIPPEQLYSFKNEFYGVAFYLKQHLQRLERVPPDGSHVLLKSKHLGDLEAILSEQGKVLETRIAPAEWLIPSERPLLVKIGPKVVS